MRTIYYKERGLTLVELMISLVIGLVIILGVVTVYLGSARSQTTNSAIVEVQNSARFAHHFLNTDLQPAGFSSVCPEEPEHRINLLDSDDNRFTNTLYNMNFPVMAWDDLASFTASTRLSTYIKDLIADDYLRGHILLVQHASRYNRAALDDDLSGGDSASLSPVGNFEAGNILLISDMQRCIIFQNQSDEFDEITLEGNLRPGNDPDEFPTFSEDPIDKDLAKLFQITSNIYFIGQGNALKRLPLSTGLDVDANSIEVLVDNIEDLRFEFGMIDDNRDLDQMTTATLIHCDLDPTLIHCDLDQSTSSLSWSEVGMIKTHLLSRSDNINVIDEPTDKPTDEPTAVIREPFSKFCDSSDGENPCRDRRLRYVFSYTAGIRNTLP